MNRLPASVHRSLDMVAVLGFLAMPILLGLSGASALVSYALAAIHLIVTLSTKFPDTGHKLLSLRTHGVIEAVVGVALIVLPWVAGWTGNARTYYVIVGVILLIICAISNYGRQYGAERAQKAHADADRG
jgi:glucose dehydrogenase